MAYEQTKLVELVDRAVNHRWSIPEFQRGFVWKSTQVRDLAESLWLDFPIGSLLVWNSGRHVEERVAVDVQRPSQWLVDGQQRTTALCVLFGRKPYWWQSSEEWNKVLKQYDIRFDIDTKEPPYFWVANAVIRKTKGNRFIPLCDLLDLDLQKEQDQKTLTEMAREIKRQGLCDGMDSMEVYARLDRIRKIRDKEVVTITIDHELEEVVEIFARLNSKGTRVTEADIYLGYVAARNPGLVRDDFIPFTNDLAESGFDINPNLLFRSIAGIGQGKTRFKDIPDKFWDSAEIRLAWYKTKMAWTKLLNYFQEYGISSNDILPTEAALVTMTSLINKFKDNIQFNFALYWFIQASRFGRYSGSSASSLDEDLRDIQESSSLSESVKKLLLRFHHEEPLTQEDFLKDYTDGRFSRFMLYLLVYQNKAQDWDESSYRIGFDGSGVMANYQPQWHHIFPKKYIEKHDGSEYVDSLANIAVIGPTINIRISAKSPMDYVSRYKITDDKLRQQFIDPSFIKIPISDFDDWARQRAEVLAHEANKYLANLRNGL